MDGNGCGTRWRSFPVVSLGFGMVCLIVWFFFLRFFDLFTSASVSSYCRLHSFDALTYTRSHALLISAPVFLVFVIFSLHLSFAYAGWTRCRCTHSLLSFYSILQIHSTLVFLCLILEDG